MTSNEAVVSSPLEQRITQANQSGGFAATSSLEFVVTQLRLHKASVALVGVLVIVALASVLFGLYKFFRRSQIASPNVPPQVVLLTSLRGIERSVAFSPDGRQIAFVWKSEFANFDVYIKLIGAGEPLRLTTNPAREMSPAWSPDGRYIAFLRATGEDKGYYLIPALGGAERKLADAYGRAQRGVMSQAVAWSPDGRTLALVDKAAENEPWCVYLLSVETGEQRRFTTPPTKTDGDTTVAFSPDGRTLAFVRSHRLVGDIYTAPGEIYLAPIAGGDPVRLTSDGATIHGLAWTPDGAELVFSSERAGSSGLPTLWRIPVAGGSPAPVMGRLGDGVFDPSISARGNHLAFAQQSFDINIYRVELTGQAGGRRKAGTPTSLISSTQADGDPRFSPDGRKIAFVSNRSGGMNLWVCEADGKNQAQLTDSLDSNTPSWSPDGRLVTFDSVVGGNADIYAVSPEGGVARRLTTEPSAETTPSWSPDGSWIYFGSNRTGRTEVWKIPAAGGAAVQVTHGGGFNPVAAPDGRTIYYLRGEKGPWLWAASTEGGGETRLFEADPEKWIEPANWVVLGGGIYFLERKPGEPYTLQFFDFETRRATPLMTLGGPGDPFAIAGLTVAPDERSMLYAQRDVLEFDLMLIENFK